MTSNAADLIAALMGGGDIRMSADININSLAPSPLGVDTTYNGAGFELSGPGLYSTGNASVRNVAFTDSPKTKEGTGRLLKHETGGVLRVSDCTFSGAGDEALLSSNWHSALDSLLIVERCQFLSNSRNAMVSQLPNTPNLDRHPMARLRAIFIDCDFFGGFRNPLCRGAEVVMVRCSWTSGGDTQFRPPMVGGYPFESRGDDVLRAGTLWYLYCVGQAPIYERGNAEGAAIIKAGTSDELPDWYHDAVLPQVTSVDEPLVCTGGLVDAADFLNAGRIYVEAGLHTQTEPLVADDDTLIEFAAGACFDGQRTQHTALILGDRTEVIGGEFKNYIPFDQRGVIEARTFTQLGDNGTYEPAHPVDLTMQATLRKTYVHDSTGYAFVLGDETLLDQCRAETMGMGGYTAHGGADQLVRGGVWKKLGIDMADRQFWEAGNKLKYTTNFRVEGGYYENIIGTGIWFDIENNGPTVDGAIVVDCTGPGVQIELASEAMTHPATVVGVWVKRCGRYGSPWLNQSGIQIYNAWALVRDFTVQDCFNGIGFLQDARSFEGRPCPTRGSFMDGRVLDSGQSGAVQDNGDMALFDRVLFSNIQWRLGLSVIPGQYDQWREANPFRWKNTAEGFDQWAGRFAGQSLITS